MCIRAYLVLQTVGKKSQQVVSELSSKPGVVMVDLLEGSPDLIIVLEAAQRQDLGAYIMKALDSVESITEDLRFFIARESKVPNLIEVAA